MKKQKEYLAQMELERKRQVDELSVYLSDYIKVNANIRNMKINEVPSEEVINKIISTPFSKDGRDPREVADELVENVFTKSMLSQHPRFFSFVTSSVSPFSLAGTILTDIYNLHAGGFNESIGASLIEEKLIRFLSDKIGYKENAGGIFTSGGSMSNLTAIVAARDKYLKNIDYKEGIAYISDQTHSSVVKDLKISGIRSNQIRIIESDDDCKFDTSKLEEVIKEDIEKGLKPFIIIGTLGTTNTGSIDNIKELAEIKEKYDLWLHIDGAYGGSILFNDEYKYLAEGIERSDSMCWDTHKWAMQTYSCSAVIVKNKIDLLNSFIEHPEYLEDIMSHEHDDAWDLGIEMTRPHRAIKLWFTIQALGTDKLAEVIDFGIKNSFTAKEELLKNKDVEITSEPSCASITFRFVPNDIDEKDYDILNEMISERAISEQFIHILTTKIKNKRVLRMCFVNSNTTKDDVVESIEYINKIEKEIKETLKK